MKVLIKSEDYEAMLRHARAELPNEACGLLAGRDDGGVRTIEKVYMLTNTDHSPEHFALSPREQLEAVKDMRVRGVKLVGNWHSHPASPARPSAEDIRLAFDKSISYLILSLEDRRNPRLRSFHIEDGVGSAEELVVEDSLRPSPNDPSPALRATSPEGGGFERLPLVGTGTTARS